MWIAFLILAVVATLVLLFHVTLELNRLDKAVTDMAELLRKRYER